MSKYVLGITNNSTQMNYVYKISREDLALSVLTYYLGKGNEYPGDISQNFSTVFDIFSNKTIVTNVIGAELFTSIVTLKVSNTLELVEGDTLRLRAGYYRSLGNVQYGSVNITDNLGNTYSCVIPFGILGYKDDTFFFDGAKLHYISEDSNPIGSLMLAPITTTRVTGYVEAQGQLLSEVFYIRLQEACLNEGLYTTVDGLIRLPQPGNKYFRRDDNPNFREQVANDAVAHINNFAINILGVNVGVDNVADSASTTTPTLVSVPLSEGNEVNYSDIHRGSTVFSDTLKYKLFIKVVD